MEKRKVWDKQTTKKATEIVRKKIIGYKSASKFYNVPRRILKYYTKAGEGLTVEESMNKKQGENQF